jgi:hypothetical protein
MLCFFLKYNFNPLSNQIFEKMKWEKLSTAAKSTQKKRHLCENSNTSISKKRKLSRKVLKEIQNSPKNEQLPKITVENFEFSSPSKKNNKKLLLNLIKTKYELVRFASKRLLDDEEVVSLAIQQDPFSLYWASDRLKNNEKFLYPLIINDENVLREASESIKRNKEFILKILKQNWKIFELLPKEVSKDKEIVQRAIENNGLALENCLDFYKNDKNLVLASVRSTWYSLEFASDSLRNDKDFILETLKIEGSCLSCASEELQTDQELVWKSKQYFKCIKEVQTWNILFHFK